MCCERMIWNSPLQACSMLSEGTGRVQCTGADLDHFMPHCTVLYCTVPYLRTAGLPVPACARLEQRWFRVKRSLACAATCQQGKCPKAQKPKMPKMLDGGRPVRLRTTPPDPSTQRRCGRCHTAFFDQRMLPQRTRVCIRAKEQKKEKEKRDVCRVALFRSSSPSLSASRLPGLQNLLWDQGLQHP